VACGRERQARRSSAPPTRTSPLMEGKTPVLGLDVVGARVLQSSIRTAGRITSARGWNVVNGRRSRRRNDAAKKIDSASSRSVNTSALPVGAVADGYAARAGIRRHWQFSTYSWSGPPQGSEAELVSLSTPQWGADDHPLRVSSFSRAENLPCPAGEVDGRRSSNPVDGSPTALARSAAGPGGNRRYGSDGSADVFTEPLDG